LSVYTSGIQAVSGAVAVSNPVQIWSEGAIGVSGSLALTTTQGLQVFTSVPQAVSGTVQVYTSGIQAVSGTVAITTSTPLSTYNNGVQAVSGTVQIWSEGALPVSGSVNILPSANAAIRVYTDVAQAVSGTVAITTNSPLQVWTEGSFGVTGSVNVSNTLANSLAVYNNGTQAVSGTVQVWSEGALPVSGTVSVTTSAGAALGVWVQGTQAVSGTVAITTTGAGLSVYTSGIQAVSGTVAITTNSPLQVWSEGSLGVSGTIAITPTANAAIRTYTDVAQAVSGTVAITTSTALSTYNNGTQAVSGTVQVWSEGALPVSGTVNVIPSANAAIRVYTDVPQAVSGTVGITTTGAGLSVYTSGIQAVSGTVAITTITPLQIWSEGSLGVSGTVNAVNTPATALAVYNNGTQAVSGTVTITTSAALSTYNTGIQAVSGTLQTWNSGLVGVSGTVGITTTPGSSLSVYTPVPQAVSGTVQVSNPVQVWSEGPVGISGSLALTTTQGLQVYTSVPQAVSGTVAITTSTALSTYDTGVQAVSGTVTVVTPTGDALAVYTLNTQGVSGSVNVYTSGPQEVSGTVAITTSTALSTYNSGIQAISGSVFTALGMTGYLDSANNWTGTTSSQPYVDVSGELAIRGNVLTDDISLCDCFSQTIPTALTGTVSFTSGSTLVTGIGTFFTKQINFFSYIKVAGDSESFYVDVSNVASDTQLTLSTPYGGTTGTGQAGVVSNWITTTGAGTISVSNSSVVLGSSTTNGNVTGIFTYCDYLPIQITFTINNISQRIANQSFVIGFQDTPNATPSSQTVFVFTGTTASQVIIRNSDNAAVQVNNTTVTLPSSLTTASKITFSILVKQTGTYYYANGILLGSNTTQTPNFYVNLYAVAYWQNTGVPGTNSTVSIDDILVRNFEELQVTATNLDPQLLQAQIQGPNQNATATTVNPVIMGGTDINGLTRTTAMSSTGAQMAGGADRVAGVPGALSLATTNNLAELLVSDNKSFNYLDVQNDLLSQIIDLLRLIVPPQVTTTQSVAGYNASVPAQQIIGTTAMMLYPGGACKQIRIVNTGTTKIYLAFNDQVPSSTAYHIALAVCSSANDGTGGVYIDDVALGQINAVSSATGGTVCVTVIN
jgi:hypothetical protein